MTNLLVVLPDLDIKPYSHILPSLEKALVNINDLLTLDTLDVAKRAQVPPGDVKKLSDAVLGGIQASNEHLAIDGDSLIARFGCISTLDGRIDEALGGGIAAGYLTEITGESAVGKTQFLLSLLLAVQLPPPHGQSKSALYISTEAPLQTSRLAQILQDHPHFTGLSEKDMPSLSRIQSTQIHDLEAQDHILRFQVPVVVHRHNIGIVVIDSIASNYRAEYDRGGKSQKGGEALAKRSAQLAQTGALLRSLARDKHIAIVVANQVADRFSAFDRWGRQMSACGLATQPSRPASPLGRVDRNNPRLSQLLSSSEPGPALLPSTDDPLALDHQQRFFTGWGADVSATNLKTPSLGLAWMNQLATRIALVKEPLYKDQPYAPGEDKEVVGWKRNLKVVFSSWCAESETGFEILRGGIRSVKPKSPGDGGG